MSARCASGSASSARRARAIGAVPEGREAGLGGGILGELGQLAIVAAVLPLALRRTRFYPRVALAGGSLAITVLASVWLWERALG